MQETFTSTLTMRISNRITDVFKPVREPRTQRSRHNFFLFLGEKKPRAAFSPGRVVGEGRYEERGDVKDDTRKERCKLY